MSDSLRITLVQCELIWGNVEQNLDCFAKLLEPLAGKTDLIVLPEMFTSGFLMEGKDKIAPRASATIKWMQDQARLLQSAIAGSIIVQENGKYFNRLYCVEEKGVITYYDKRHLFRMGDEHSHFEQGKERIVFRIGKWRICPMICYDLRFPVWSRNQNEYDLLLYVANWPKARNKVWNTLLKARAIENQCYVAGVNRVGCDGMNLNYSGGSVLVDAKGNVLAACEESKTQCTTYELSLVDLYDFRKKFPVLLDADSFEIRT